MYESSRMEGFVWCTTKVPKPVLLLLILANTKYQSILGIL